jgi:integrase
MGIRKKGGSWFIDYRVEGRRKREKIGPSKRLAEQVLAKRQTEIAEGRYLDRKKIPRVRLEEFATEYLEYSAANKRNYGRERYTMRHLLKAFGDYWLGEISVWHVEQYKAQRRALVAAATVNRELTLLKHMFTKATDWAKARTNPVKGVKLLREANTRVRFLTDEEEVRLLRACPPNLRPLVLAALHTGFRRGELLSLRWCDVDFANGLITVEASYTKNGERRSVPLSRTLRTILEQLRQQRTEGEHIFRTRRGGRYVSAATTFKKAVERAGLTNFRFHDLRHTFASRLVMGGQDIRTVQELLGHKSITMTLRYSHLSPTHRAKAVAILDRLSEEIAAAAVDTFWTPGDNSADVQRNRAC